MQKRKLPRMNLFTILAVLISGIGPLVDPVLAQSFPEEWILGDRLLAGALFLIAFGWITGVYALLFTHTAPVIKRALLYPLLKVMGRSGEKKSLVTKR